MNSTLNKRTFRECIDAIVKSFPQEDVFESLIHFLTTSVEVRFDTVFSPCCISYIRSVGTNRIVLLESIYSKLFWFSARKGLVRIV